MKAERITRTYRGVLIEQEGLAINCFRCHLPEGITGTVAGSHNVNPYIDARLAGIELERSRTGRPDRTAAQGDRLWAMMSDQIRRGEFARLQGWADRMASVNATYPEMVEILVRRTGLTLEELEEALAAIS